MARISSLQIHNFRNIHQASIETGPLFNVFYGNNGAGKTSLLEAIHYLAVGKSFRTHQAQRLIQQEHNQFSLFATLSQNDHFRPLGVQKNRSGQRQLKLDGEMTLSWSPVAKLLPVRILSAMCHRFLQDGPKIRRQFLDWLLFHVEPSFLHAWQQIQQLLKQRNAALKARLPKDQITCWDASFITYAEHINLLRENMVQSFAPIFNSFLAELVPEITLELSFHRGWHKDSSLQHRFSINFHREYQTGVTLEGPHRADLVITQNKIAAEDVLSQGQQKLVTYALYLAQGKLLQQVTGNSPIYLIDDLVAELDQEKRRFLCQTLQNLNSQVFITGTAVDELQFLTNNTDHLMFHVEHGNFSAAKKIYL